MTCYSASPRRSAVCTAMLALSMGTARHLEAQQTTAATSRLLVAARSEPAPTHGVRPRRRVIRNAMVIEGNGTPAEGPKDIVVEGGRITDDVTWTIKDGIPYEAQRLLREVRELVAKAKGTASR